VSIGRHSYGVVGEMKMWKVDNAKTTVWR
jgi:hypothetical protein